jgi:hypothetical protein
MSDLPAGIPPDEQFRDTLRVVDSTVQAGLSYISFGQHFLYGDLTYLQPDPPSWPHASLRR